MPRRPPGTLREGAEQGRSDQSGRAEHLQLPPWRTLKPRQRSRTAQGRGRATADPSVQSFPVHSGREHEEERSKGWGEATRLTGDEAVQLGERRAVHGPLHGLLGRVHHAKLNGAGGEHLRATQRRPKVHAPSVAPPPPVAPPLCENARREAAPHLDDGGEVALEEAREAAVLPHERGALHQAPRHLRT